MNKGMLTVGIILLSVIALLLINVLTNYSSGSELDYYLVKETTNAAMTDAMDYDYLRTCGLPRIDKEKLVESFILRFANNVDGSRGYKISFYDINEVPPKVSVKVDSATVLSFKVQETKNGKTSTKTDDIDMTTSYDAIIETSNIVDPTLDYHLNKYKSDVCLSYNANS